MSAALRYLQEDAAFTRRGKAGQEREEAGLIIATFEHGTSRAQDPQLHTHSLILNVAVRRDGTTGTIESKPLYQHKMAAGAVYRAEFDHQLEARLNLRAERQKSWFELPDVPKPLVEEFSKRRHEIEAVMDRQGKDSAQAAAVAALSTRQVKEHVARESLFEGWRDVGEKHGFGPEEVRSLLHSRKIAPERNQAEAIPGTLHAATTRLMQRDSYFSGTNFIRAAAEESQGKGISVLSLLPAARKYLADNPEIVFLGTLRGEAQYSTREMLGIEAAMLEQVERSRGNDSHTASPENYTRAILTRPLMSEEQAKALHHITAKEGSIQAVSGLAGTGKTLLLDAAREVWEKEGLTVLGGALAGKAAAGLAEGAKIQSQTLHRTLSQIERGDLRLGSRTVLVVDEAAMVGTRQMAALIKATEESRSETRSRGRR